MRSSIQNLKPYDPGLTHKQLTNKIGKEIIKLSANENLWGTSPLVKEYLQTGINDLHYYPDGAAHDLKKALSLFWNLSPEYFCLGNGTDDLIFMLATTFLNPGEKVIIPTPTFSSYATAVTIVGGEIKLIPQENLQINLEKLIPHINSQVRIVFLCNPNNPTGTYFNHTKLHSFLEQIPLETIIVLDEAYFHYATAVDFPRTQELLVRYPNLVVLHTFSKAYGLAGLRIGYAIAQPQITQELAKVRQPYNVNTFAQEAALIALQDQKYVQKIVQETIHERKWLTQKMRQCGLTVLPSQANFLLVQIKNTTKICAQLVQEGFLLRDTASFGLADWLRITLGPHEFMKELWQHFKKYLGSEYSLE